MRVTYREGKTEFDVAERPKRAEYINKNCPASNPSSNTHWLCDLGQDPDVDSVSSFVQWG